jgi:hypothetical protein
MPFDWLVPWKYSIVATGGICEPRKSKVSATRLGG